MSVVPICNCLPAVTMSVCLASNVCCCRLSCVWFKVLARDADDVAMFVCLVSDRIEVPESVAADVHPRHLDVPQHPQDQYHDPTRPAGGILCQSLACCSRLPPPGERITHYYIDPGLKTIKTIDSIIFFVPMLLSSQVSQTQAT